MTPVPFCRSKATYLHKDLVMYNLNFDVGSRLTCYVLDNVSFPQSFWLHRSVAAF